ncbi:hypothetical protein BDN72DRAFT_936573 [Pluteus cervinus]|uniref:Uncharacterized protein n=1 Tax=Pluteus cervinus TaxID=181527 RepID=A0ACD3A6G5_9AGAR|nr:hypothetical protein BDN72DRAFT_936573 [Pluteus cervinus]
MSVDFKGSFAIENKGGSFIGFIGDGTTTYYACLVSDLQKWDILPVEESGTVMVAFKNESKGFWLGHKTPQAHQPIIGGNDASFWVVKQFSPDGYFRIETTDGKYEIGVGEIILPHQSSSGGGIPIQHPLVLVPKGQGENWKLHGVLGVPKFPGSTE